MKAILDCEHVVDVPECCNVGTITACEECGEHENRQIVDIWEDDL